MSEPATAILKSSNGEPLALRGVAVSGRVEGLLLRMSVRQSFRNDNAAALECIYTFPLSLDAVLLGMSADLGGRHLESAVAKASLAEALYEDSVSRGDSAVLLERNGDGLYTASLGNLGPGESATIEYSYAALLRFDDDLVRIRVPTTIAPRYGDPVGQGGLPVYAVPVADLSAEYDFALSIVLTGALAHGRVTSPTHTVLVEDGENELHVRLAESARLDRDCVLTIAGIEARALTIAAPDGNGWCVLASFCPELTAPPRERVSLKVLVDCSGSMAGDSIASARAALHNVVTMKLAVGDRVSVSRFGDRVEHLVPAFAFERGRDARYLIHELDALQADMGGTEIAQALTEVFALPRESEETDVLLITDGAAWESSRVIDAARRSGHRVFAIGVGSSPAESLLRRIANATGGSCELVTPNEDMRGAVQHIFRRIRAPRVSEVAVEWGGIAPLWQTPEVSTLFAGETLHVFAGFEQRPEAAPRLTWQSDGISSHAQAPAPEISAETVLARMAASARIDYTNRQKATEMAMRYGLVSAHTSFVLTCERAPDEKPTVPMRAESIVSMLAAGWGGVGSARTGKRLNCCVPVLLDRHSISPLDMDLLHIPAFLRSKADGCDNLLPGSSDSAPHGGDRSAAGRKSADELTPLDLMNALARALEESDGLSSAILSINELRLPKHFTDLAAELTSQAISWELAWALTLLWVATRLKNPVATGNTRQSRFLGASRSNATQASLALVLKHLKPVSAQATPEQRHAALTAIGERYRDVTRERWVLV